MKQLSVIIPHYNSLKLLKKLLLTIPNEKEIEIIVVDDKSTKNVEELKGLRTNPEFEHIIFISNETSLKNAGTCRNIGLETATGKWIIFADSDDYFVVDFYEKIKKYFNTEYEVVFFKPTSIYLDTNEKSDRHLKYNALVENYLERNSLENELKLRYEFGVPWSKLIKNKLIKENNIKFDEVIARNDKLFSTKIGFYMNEFFVSDEIVYCVTRNKGSITMTMTDDAINSRVNVFIRNYNFIQKNISVEQKKHINLSGFNVLLSIYQSGAGFSKIVSTYKLFRKENIKILDRRYLNPLFIIKRTFLILRIYKNERKYHSNTKTK